MAVIVLVAPLNMDVVVPVKFPCITASPRAGGKSISHPRGFTKVRDRLDMLFTVAFPKNKFAFCNMLARMGK